MVNPVSVPARSTTRSPVIAYSYASPALDSVLPFPAFLPFRLSTERRRYLDAVLDRDRHDPPHILQAFGRRLGPVHRGLAYLLEEALVQAPGVWFTSILLGLSPTFLWACRMPLGT